MGKYQTYSEYRSWNNKWISCLPASWQLVPLKYICSGFVKDGPHETPKFTDDGIPFLSVDGIQDNKLVFNGCRYISEEDHVRYSMKCHPKQGDVLLGKAASVGKVAYVDSNMDFNVWSPLAVITAKSNKYGKYIYYCLQSSMLQAQCEVFANSNTQKNLGMNTIDNLDMPLPSEHEADVITNFLDHETAKIDTLIEKQQQLIKLLKEKRQAVISHAVTKGLNPEAPMKDSGVEWLGEVPKHWDVLNLAGVADVIDPNPSHRNPKYTEDGYPFISTVEFIGIDDVETNTPRRVAEETVIEQEQRCRFSEGSIAFSRKGTIGEVRILPKDVRFALLDSVCVINAGSRIAYEFLYQQCRSSLFDSQLGAETRGAALKQVSVGRVRGIKTFVPPMSEQKEIVSFLSVELGKLDLLIQKANQGIALMNERRTALISAAVTGKIDVRNWQAPTSQNQAMEQTA